MTGHGGLIHGTLVLPNSQPAVNTDANAHGDRGCPSSSTTARAAIPIASTASANRPPAGRTPATEARSSVAAHPVKCARIGSARSSARRSHPRTVVAGSSNSAAIASCVAPAALATSAAPITAAASRRRAKHTSGNTTCVFSHPRQRDRRGTSHKSSGTAPPRTRRHRPRA